MPPRTMAKYDIAIIGGDRRTACMAPILVEKGYRVLCFHTVETVCSQSIKSKIYYTESLREALDSAPVIIGGIPFTKSDALYCESNVSTTVVSLTEIQRSIHRHQRFSLKTKMESFLVKML